jgi:hypothetical protein
MLLDARHESLQLPPEEDQDAGIADRNADRDEEEYYVLCSISHTSIPATSAMIT